MSKDRKESRYLGLGPNLELHYVERMSEKEIALVYHLPASTIRGRIHRAKKKLRKELDV